MDGAPGKLVITGEDRFLGYSLMCGAQAALIGMAAACTVTAGRAASGLLGRRDARGSSSSARRDRRPGPAHVLAPMEGYIHRMLWCLVHQGVIPEDAAHDPWGPALDPSEFDRIGTSLARLEQLRSARSSSPGVDPGEAMPPSRPHLLPRDADVPHERAQRVRADFERFASQGLPEDLERYLRESYGLDMTASYAGMAIRNPWGKASGQLSLNRAQIDEAADAGLGLVVLKTVIAQDAAGSAVDVGVGDQGIADGPRADHAAR